MITRRQFADRLLRRIQAPVTRHNRVALVSWMQTEGYGGRNNPMNTTLRLPGSTTFNSHGVQNYVTIDQGCEAIARTLLHSNEEYRYASIIRHLRRDERPRYTLEALLRSSWGTTDLVLDVLEDAQDQDKWEALATAPAAKEA